MDYDRLLEKYFAAYPDIKQRDRTRTIAVIKILKEHNIEQPTENDYQQKVKPEVMKLPRVESENTADGYITCARKFFKWLSKTGDKTMDLMQTENEKEVKSGISAADMATKENDSTVVECESQPVQAEAEPESMSNEAHEVPLPEQPELQAEPAKAVSQRGRKPKPENENRVQISAYLNRAVYEGVKALSDASNQTISDIVAKAIEAFYEENREMIEESIRLVALQESIKARIKYTKR